MAQFIQEGIKLIHDERYFNRNALVGFARDEGTVPRSNETIFNTNVYVLAICKIKCNFICLRFAVLESHYIRNKTSVQYESLK